MEQIKALLEALSQHLEKLARGNAVVARPVSVGERSIIPLCELSLGIGGGGGTGETESETETGKEPRAPEKGTGGGAGGSAKAIPVAVIVVDGDDVHLERLG